MGAEKASYNLPRDYNKNVSQIFKYSHNTHQTSTVPQKPTAPYTGECEGPRHMREGHKESESTNGIINGENGHTNGTTNGQINEVVNEMKSIAIEKGITT